MLPIQLAIQGGGARITHLLAALEAVQSLESERLLRVTRIAGTSAGAIAGALYAARVDMSRAREAFQAERGALLRAFSRSGANMAGAWRVLTGRPLWDPEPLRRVLERLLDGRPTLGALDIPLLIVASDLTNMKPCVYSGADEPLVSSMLDSAGIPFYFRPVPRSSDGAYRVLVDGGLCENLPADVLQASDSDGAVFGITFAPSRVAAPLTSIAGFTRAILETSMNAAVLRAQRACGKTFVIRTDAASFDFRRAFTHGLGAEYRETRLLAERWFRAQAERPAAGQQVFPERRLPDVVRALRTMYDAQHEPVPFEFITARMIVTAASQADADKHGPDNIRHEIVFRAGRHPISCYRIRLTPADAPDLQKTQCELFDVRGNAVAYDLVPVPDEADQAREYLLFFRTPVVPGDARAPITLRVRDAVRDALRLMRDGRDELIMRVSRADRPISRAEIIVHLPEERADTSVITAPGSTGTLMSPAELIAWPAPAGFFSLGWKGESVPPKAPFGCHIVRR